MDGLFRKGADDAGIGGRASGREDGLGRSEANQPIAIQDLNLLVHRLSGAGAQVAVMPIMLGMERRPINLSY